MNVVIAKQASILAAILGAIIGIIALISPLMIYIIPTLMFLCAPLVIVCMKKRKELGYLDIQQGAFLGGVIGTASSIGFFAAFIPLVLIIGLIFKQYYTYGIPYFLNFQSLWLFVLILITLIATLAVTNAVSGMGTIYIYNQIEPKPPESEEGPIDITIE